MQLARTQNAGVCWNPGLSRPVIWALLTAFAFTVSKIQQTGASQGLVSTSSEGEFAGRSVCLPAEYSGSEFINFVYIFLIVAVFSASCFKYRCYSACGKWQSDQARVLFWDSPQCKSMLLKVSGKPESDKWMCAITNNIIHTHLTHLNVDFFPSLQCLL